MTPGTPEGGWGQAGANTALGGLGETADTPQGCATPHPRGGEAGRSSSNYIFIVQCSGVVHLQARPAPVARGSLQAAWTGHWVPGTLLQCRQQVVLPHAGGRGGGEGVTSTQGQGQAAPATEKGNSDWRRSLSSERRDSPASAPGSHQSDIGRTWNMMVARQGAWGPQSPGSDLPQEPSWARGSRGSQGE